MAITDPDIITRLQKDILGWQGLKQSSNNCLIDAALGPIKMAFPNGSFPSGAIHEFISMGPEATAATGGFIGVLLASLMQANGTSVWISASRNIFPPALKSFGLKADKIIFVDLKKEKEILWVMEEALKCNGLSAVIGEMQELDFTASRRLQLAVEQSKVTGFILRRNPKNINTTACVSRWKITPLPADSSSGMPGVSYPRWNVSLLKVRNGKPDAWQIEFSAGRLRQINRLGAISLNQKKKAG